MDQECGIITLVKRNRRVAILRFGIFLWCLLFACVAREVSGQESYISYPALPDRIGSITVLDCKGRFVSRIPPQKRYWTPINRIPSFLQQAIIAVEDARFYEHNGVDYRSIARAAVTDVIQGKVVQGGSTITQQLAKNKYLDSSKTLDRKLKEAEIARELEKNYSKRQILEMYFNEIYFGNGAYGIAQAARLYFDKRPAELSEAECVLLAGVPKNPGSYNPFGKPAAVALRRDTVLKRMLELNLITAAKRRALRSQGARPRPAVRAPHYLSQVRSQLVERLGAETVELGGMEVTVALDLDLQQKAEQALRDGVRRLSPELQGALVCIDPGTGDVLAAVGDAAGARNSINRAFVSRRQSGSAIKPLIYAAALEKGITANSLWDDTPESYDRGDGRSWRPLNYANEHFGEISLRQALAHSSNIITVKLLDAVGVQDFVDFARRAGLPLRVSSGLSLALGTDDVTLKDLVQAYTPLAAGGRMAEARTIVRIYDRTHRIRAEVLPVTTQVMSPAAAFVTTEMLKDVLTYGTAKGLAVFSRTHACAGKTGTTDNYMDAWFVGYTPSLVAGVWVGYDRPRPGGKGFTGGAIAAPVWERFMTMATGMRPAGDFVRPEMVVSRTIDSANGLLARGECPEKKVEFFIAGTEPVEICPAHEGEPVPIEPAPAPADAAIPEAPGVAEDPQRPLLP